MRNFFKKHMGIMAGLSIACTSIAVGLSIFALPGTSIVVGAGVMCFVVVSTAAVVSYFNNQDEKHYLQELNAGRNEQEEDGNLLSQAGQQDAKHVESVLISPISLVNEGSRLPVVENNANRQSPPPQQISDELIQQLKDDVKQEILEKVREEVRRELEAMNNSNRNNNYANQRVIAAFIDSQNRRSDARNGSSSSSSGLSSSGHTFFDVANNMANDDNFDQDKDQNQTKKP